ncbi:MAG TPA: TonB family protein [Myxococcota bacterium]|nr:TonB family protein [Myxococcota bacterium]
MTSLPLIIHGRRSSARRHREPLERIAIGPALSSAFAYPGYEDPDGGARTRAFVTGSALFHGLIFGALALLAALAPVIEEHVIPVQLLREELPPPPPPPQEPASAPKALAMRRNLPFAPAVQAVAPQIVNPKIIAEAKPVVAAQAIQMDALGASTAPAEIQARTTVVEHVSVLDSAARAQVSPVDVQSAAGPAVRGPTRVEGVVGPSVGPRKVEAVAAGTTMGTAPIQIGSGNGSSVREGVLSDRDVIGSPDGAVVVSVDTTIGDGLLAGNTPGGAGTAIESKTSCLDSPAVKSYLDGVRQRMYERWVLPPGVDAGRKVTMRFHLDVAGSASKVSIVKAEDNALGASAVDALRAAAPFPPMPEDARCLSSRPIVGTFSNPVGG